VAVTAVVALLVPKINKVVALPPLLLLPGECWLLLLLCPAPLPPMHQQMQTALGRVSLKLIHPVTLRGGRAGSGTSVLSNWGWGSNQLHCHRTVLGWGVAESALMTLPPGPSGVGEERWDAFTTLQMHPNLVLDVATPIWVHNYSVSMVPSPSEHCSCASGGRGGGRGAVVVVSPKGYPRGAKVPEHAT
jgi:hypothetical protein